MSSGGFHPRIRSGKILRGTMKRIADGTPYTTPATIDDPLILEEIASSLKRWDIRNTTRS
jgi:propionyl-CoA synthetase